MRCVNYALEYDVILVASNDIKHCDGIGKLVLIC